MKLPTRRQGDRSVALDAYTQPRRIVEGCKHMLGCKCDTPYWLRAPSRRELKRFRKLRITEAT